MANIMRNVNMLDYIEEYNNVTKIDVKNAIAKYFDIDYEAISIVKPLE